MTEIEIFTRELRCDLTEKELVERATKLSQVLDDRRTLKITAKESAQSYKDRIGGLDDEVLQLARTVRNKFEMRPIECQMIPNDKEGTVDTVRTDTGETIQSRTMTSEERQPGLPGIPKKKGKKKADETAEAEEESGL